MGAVIRKLFDSLFKVRDVKILILGLDGAGKTTIVNRLKLGEVTTTVPTIGFNIETVQYNRAKLAIWDVGGQTKIRMLWKHYFQGTNGIIFVIDSTDKERLELAKKELHSLLANQELTDATLLVMANKEDLGGMRVDEIKETLELETTKNRKWNIQSCSAKTGSGITGGFDWLCKTIARRS